LSSELDEVTGRWDYTSLPPNVQIGEGCFIEQRDSFERCRSTRDPAVTIGDRVRIYSWTRFSLEPSGRVQVGDDSILVGAMFMGADSIRIGKRVVVSYFVTIADCDFHPSEPEARRRDAAAIAPGGEPSQSAGLVARPVVIEDDVWIGIGAIVLKGVTIGAGARVQPGAVVTQDVPAGATIAGNPGVVEQQ
jgi:acetyltransferase-like isoleucine patch superfamily enzyme